MCFHELTGSLTWQEPEIKSSKYRSAERTANKGAWEASIVQEASVDSRKGKEALHSMMAGFITKEGLKATHFRSLRSFGTTWGGDPLLCDRC